MESFIPLSVVDQLVAHLRGAITRGELGDTMPGIRSLAGTMGVSSNTVTAAIKQLEREHFLELQGHGRRSRIVLPEGFVRPAFQVTLLLYERADLHLDYVVEIQRQLKEKGHAVLVAEKSLVDLGMKVSRMARMVEHTKTDAWVVFSAPQEVLEWFVTHSVPAFAWCKPSISCIQWQSHSWVRRVVRWVDDVANGKDDRRQSFTQAKFVEKGSIGPVPSISVPPSSALTDLTKAFV